ncbi:MAG: vWA domain-containing protein [Succinivibrio sp.]
MQNKSAALPIMVSNYSKLFGVSVRMQGTQAYTNGSVITIPRVDVNDPVTSRLAYGYLAHEASHVRYTDFSIVNRKDVSGDYMRFSLFNILEDCRIEKLIAREFIGVFENLNLLNEYYEADWEKLRRNAKSVNLINTLYAFIQCYSQSYCQGFESAKKRVPWLYFHLRKRMRPKDLNAIAKLCRKINDAESTKAVLDITDSIIDIISSKEFEFKDDKSRRNHKEEDMLTSKKQQDAYKELIDIKGAPETLEQKRLMLEIAKSKAYTNSDPGLSTPNRQASDIIEENLDVVASSSREDLGVFKECTCSSGDPDFIRTLKDTWPVRNALQRKVRSYVECYGMSTVSGVKLDPLKVQKIRTGEVDIFKDRIDYEDFSTSIHILVDVSSSMLSTDGRDYSRAYEACRVALMLALSLEGVDGIKSMVTFFPGVSSEFEIALRSNERATSVASRFDQKPRGSTPLAQAIWYALSQVSELECNRNIILVITDGMPDSKEQADRCIEFARKNKVEIYGISIRSECIQMLLENAEVIENADELEKKAFCLFCSLFDTTGSVRSSGEAADIQKDED